jgi:hypothetical protein
VKKRFGYTDQGKLKKHLGIWYEEFKDENGELSLVATIAKLIQGIIRLYKNHTGSATKEYDTPGTPGQSNEKWEGEAVVESTMYRNIVGKIKCLTTNIMVEGANMARELSRQFGNPCPDDWKELGCFVRYLKINKEGIKIMFRKPRVLSFLSNVDSNYAANKEGIKSV